VLNSTFVAYYVNVMLFLMHNTTSISD